MKHTIATARIIFAGGGTGGHLYPAIAIANRVRELLGSTANSDFLFIGTKRGIEYRNREQIGYPLHLINVRGLVRAFTLKNLLVPFVLLGSLINLSSLFSSFAPHLIVGTGGYVSYPVLKMAQWKRIPYVLQEQNSFPGITTRQFASGAEKVFLGFAGAKVHLNNDADALITGNPVRADILNGDKARVVSQYKLDPDKKIILILGGSQGAHAINEAILKSIEHGSLSDNCQLIWQTGKRDYNSVSEKIGSKHKHIVLFPFADNMADLYATADIAVARAGALTIAELEATTTPSILIPYPQAAGDHQRKNAHELKALGGAVEIDQDELPSKDIIKEVCELLSSEKYSEIKDTLAKLTEQREPAVDVIATEIVSILNCNREGLH